MKIYFKNLALKPYRKEVPLAVLLKNKYTGLMTVVEYYKISPKHRLDVINMFNGETIYYEDGCQTEYIVGVLDLRQWFDLSRKAMRNKERVIFKMEDCE